MSCHIHIPQKKPKSAKKVKKPKASIEEEQEIEAKKPGRTIEDVIKRFKWDQDYDTDDVTIGYEDRFTPVILISNNFIRFKDCSISEERRAGIFYYCVTKSGDLSKLIVIP